MLILFIISFNDFLALEVGGGGASLSNFVSSHQHQNFYENKLQPVLNQTANHNTLQSVGVHYQPNDASSMVNGIGNDTTMSNTMHQVKSQFNFIENF